MNLQPILRAAVCAVMVVVCVAGAGWFLIQPAAAQETKQQLPRGGAGNKDNTLSESSSPEFVTSSDPVQTKQIYRPGLRNSFLGDQLGTQELNLVLAQLRHKTGFVQMRFDNAGFLTIDDRSQIVGGSEAARELLLAAIDGKESINLQSQNRSRKVVFAQASEAASYTGWQSDLQIAVETIEIDFEDFNQLRGDRKAIEAFDLGFVILHELCHAALELHDPSVGVDGKGDCESYVNRIRRELGMPERQQYAATGVLRMPFSSETTFRVARLIFKQAESGRELENRPKRKRLYLMWNIQRVGNNHRLSDLSQ